MILDVFTKQRRGDHHMRTIADYRIVAGDGPEPVIKSQTGHRDVNVLCRDIGAFRFAIGPISDEAAAAAPVIGAEIKEKGAIVADIGLADLPDLLIRCALTREHERLRAVQRIAHDRLGEVERRWQDDDPLEPFFDQRERSGQLMVERNAPSRPTR